MTVSLAFVASPALAVAPDSPEVKALLEKPITFLETAHEGRLGGKCLIGIVMLKSGRPADHPQVLAAIKACQNTASAEPEKITTDIYSTGIAIIFLCTVDPSRYSGEIVTLQKSLEHRQKDHGGWGYPDKETGDTSMTQYGVLSGWEAKQVGFAPSLESVERVANWLIRTQDPNGGWGYQGVDPGDYKQVDQGVRLTMTTAAAGSSIICADMLGLVDLKEEKQDDLPKALKLVEEEQPAGEGLSEKVDPRRLRRAIELGGRRVAADYEIKQQQWVYYYLYALERYMSFRDLANGSQPKEPRWYNDGYKFLVDNQTEQGTWNAQSGEAVDTAFAVLFLLRSTKQSIEHSRGFGDGTLVGGRGLPRNLVDVKLRRGRVVSGALASQVKDMVRILNDPEHPDYDYLVDNPSELLISDEPKLASDQMTRLQAVVRSGAPEARRAAAVALARTDKLDAAPSLIFALTDPDPGVYLAARDGLRRVSRKFQGFGMPDDPNAVARAEGIGKWKDWCRAIRPDVVFER